MKKLNKLFAILIAVLGVQTLSAQKDVTDTYLKNAGFEDGTNYWTYGGNGTHYGGVAAYGSSTTYNSVTLISVDKFGESKGNALHTSAGWGSPSLYTQEVTLPAGDYKLTFDVINCNSSATRITNRFGWVPNSGTAIYSSVSDIIYNAWQTISVTFTLNTQTTGKISVGMVSTSGSGSGAVAKLFTDNVRIFKMDENSEATIAKPIDYSDLINQSKWSYAEDDGSGSVSSLTTNVNKGEWPYRMVERYRGAGGHYGKKLYQTISLPSGVYQVQAACMSAHANGVEGGNALPDGTLDNAYFYANDEEVTYALANATSTFQKNIVTLNNDGTIEFGVKTVARGANWNAIGCATVIKVANSYEEYLQDLFGELYTERFTLISKLEALQSEIPEPYYSNTVSPAIENANNATTQETLTEANNALKNILTNAEKMVEPYASLKSLIALCTEYTSTQNSNANSTEVLTTFQAAISTATTVGNNATSADAINTAYNNLENARRIYAQNAVPVYPYGFDMTFLLTNPNFDSNIDGWTATGGAGRMGAGNIECYNNTFTFALANKLTGLGNGTWEVSVDGFYRYGGYNAAETAHNGGTEDLKVKFYANANEVVLKSIMEGANKAGGVGATTTGGVRVPNSPADGNSYFPTGCYSNTVSTLVTDGTLTFGLKKESTQGSDWTLFDNFRLVYKGVDVSELQSSLSALITTANGIKDTKMGSTEKTNLDNAIKGADASATDADELNEMLSTLQSAYDAAMASIDTYSKVPAYIAKAKAIGVTLAETYQEQYDNSTIEGNAETVFQALEVATYNYVKENFPYDVELLKADGWNSKGENTAAADFSNEHWSGETRKYKNQDDNNGQGWNASAWSIDFDQSVTLPAGEYVFKVAGRKSAEATLELTVTMGETILGSVNDFPSSNNTRGINKAGATSFDANNDPEGFANNGNGFGWQWRYVKFALATESTVKVAVHAETNAIHQWVSFGDYTLHMDESAYLETNMDGLIAPMEAAEALVGVKPMGKDEATAIQTAIDMTVTTGAELKAKIDALNTAVANANQWVVDYNNAKAPLVAALERFEADYNDAQNGALNHMNKGRWATAISMAQAAAVAKDTTNSYDGFAAATENLVAALDAATTSVNEYSALDAAIKTAKPLYEGGNWGDQAFQRPKRAKESLNTENAQKVYDAATADGEDVTSVTEALNNGLNGIVINEPAEDDVFKVAISFGNWDFNGRPLTFADDGKGGVSMYRDRDDNYYAQTLKFKKVEGNKYTMSTITADGTELYVSTGSASGHGDSNVQIRLTDDEAKALSIEVIPTATEGWYNLKNTEADALLGCQDDNSKEKGGLFTVGVRNDFTITKVDMPSVTLKTPSYWATLILPFAAEIPEGLTVYSCAGADGDVLTLETVESIEANTPYLVCGATTDFKHTFTGFGAATTTSYTVGLFTGTYVDYKTTANSNTYVLQKNNGDVAFYLVGESSGQPTVGANRCYMVYEGAAGAPKFSFGRGGDTTSIEGSELDAQGSVLIYDLMGRKVTTMEKGGMYIVNGKKVVIK